MHTVSRDKEGHFWFPEQGRHAPDDQKPLPTRSRCRAARIHLMLLFGGLSLSWGTARTPARRLCPQAPGALGARLQDRR